MPMRFIKFYSIRFLLYALLRCKTQMASRNFFQIIACFWQHALELFCLAARNSINKAVLTPIELVL